jgi:hypothetical protein
LRTISPVFDGGEVISARPVRGAAIGIDVEDTFLEGLELCGFRQEVLDEI